MNSGKIVADGWTDGWTGRGSIRGPRGPKKYTTTGGGGGDSYELSWVREAVKSVKFRT